MTHRPALHWALLVPLAVIVSLAAACSSTAASRSPLTELQRVATVTPGEPVLVYVYTDG